MLLQARKEGRNNTTHIQPLQLSIGQFANFVDVIQHRGSIVINKIMLHFWGVFIVPNQYLTVLHMYVYWTTCISSSYTGIVKLQFEVPLQQCCHNQRSLRMYIFRRNNHSFNLQSIQLCCSFCTKDYGQWEMPQFPNQWHGLLLQIEF